MWLIRSVSTVILCLTLASNGEEKSALSPRSFRSYLKKTTQLVIFPKGSAIIITSAVLKHVISLYPRGWMVTVEIDAYHDLPFKDAIPATVPSKPMNKLFEVSKPKSYLEHSPIPNWAIPGHRRLDHYPNYYSINPKYSDFSIYVPQKYHQPIIPVMNFNRADRITMNRKPPPPRIITPYEKQTLYPGYRQKRRIFDYIEDAARKLGWNIKYCVLRTICETRYFLLPPGLSLIQDIIRILFDLTRHTNWHDEYSQASRINKDQCSIKFVDMCPISIVELILHNKLTVTQG